MLYSSVVSRQELAAAQHLNSGAIHLLRGLRAVDRASGLTSARLSALSVLVFGGAMPLGRLAKVEEVASPTMTKIVDGLVAQGYARRATHADSARITMVEATARGRRVMRASARRRHLAIAAAIRAAAPAGPHVGARRRRGHRRAPCGPAEGVTGDARWASASRSRLAGCCRRRRACDRGVEPMRTVGVGSGDRARRRYWVLLAAIRLFGRTGRPAHVVVRRAAGARRGGTGRRAPRGRPACGRGREPTSTRRQRTRRRGGAAGRSR